MMFTMKPAKLLISILPRDKGEQYVAITKAAGARGGTLTYGRTHEGGRLMCLLSLADVHHEIVFTLMGDEACAVLDAVKHAASENSKKRNGLAMLLDVGGRMFRTEQAQTIQTGQDVEKRTMQSGYTLITVIVNNGYGDDVMVAARKAGATGGTILNARGTGTEDDVRFFGINLVPEKEMLLIVAENEKISAIVDAVNATPHLCEPGGGIVYTMNVEEFVVLGKA